VTHGELGRNLARGLGGSAVDRDRERKWIGLRPAEPGLRAADDGCSVTCSNDDSPQRYGSSPFGTEPHDDLLAPEWIDLRKFVQGAKTQVGDSAARRPTECRLTEVKYDACHQRGTKKRERAGGPTGDEFCDDWLACPRSGAAVGRDEVRVDGARHPRRPERDEEVEVAGLPTSASHVDIRHDRHMSDPDIERDERQGRQKR
jgi:hypothetical protein